MLSRQKSLKFYFDLSCLKINVIYKCDALRNLAPFVHMKNMKNTHGEVIFLLKLQAY